jgi:plastocyanin
MKTGSIQPSAAANDPATTPWPRKDLRIFRPAARVNLRTFSTHLNKRLPGTRTRSSLLRTVTLVVVMAGQLVLQPSLAGTITGTVRAEKRAGADSGGDPGGGAYDNRKYKFVPRVDYSTLRDFVVSIEDVTVTNAAPNTNMVAVNTSRVAQQGATFSPHVLPILAGTTVEWPNNDDIFHNVFCDSSAGRFDLGLYKGNPPEKRWTFDKPGRADVFCSIHSNMHCIVLVMPNPWFAKTDADGHFTIPDVPPGKYRLKAWQERMPSQIIEITVPAEGEVKADFTLTTQNLPQI